MIRQFFVSTTAIPFLCSKICRHSIRARFLYLVYERRKSNLIDFGHFVDLICCEKRKQIFPRFLYEQLDVTMISENSLDSNNRNTFKFMVFRTSIRSEKIIFKRSNYRVRRIIQSSTVHGTSEKFYNFYNQHK